MKSAYLHFKTEKKFVHDSLQDKGRENKWDVPPKVFIYLRSNIMNFIKYTIEEMFWLGISAN